MGGFEHSCYENRYDFLPLEFFLALTSSEIGFCASSFEIGFCTIQIGEIGDTRKNNTDSPSRHQGRASTDGGYRHERRRPEDSLRAKLSADRITYAIAIRQKLHSQDAERRILAERQRLER